jgi:hypothetical protein
MTFEQIIFLAVIATALLIGFVVWRKDASIKGRLLPTRRLQMFTTSKVTRMTTLSAALLGVAILSTALTSTATPALALGGCGPNAHRGFWGGCRWGK